jgi:hypothetical protein
MDGAKVPIAFGAFLHTGSLWCKSPTISLIDGMASNKGGLTQWKSQFKRLRLVSGCFLQTKILSELKILPIGTIVTMSTNSLSFVPF